MWIWCACMLTWCWHSHICFRHFVSCNYRLSDDDADDSLSSDIEYDPDNPMDDVPDLSTEPKETFELKPLYQNSDSTVCGAYCSIMLFASRHKLSLSAISDLLALLRLLCPDPIHLPWSLYKFQQFFKQFNAGCEKQTFCRECTTPLSSSKSHCSNRCCSNSGKHSYLDHLPIEKSLQAIVSSKQIILSSK